MRGTPSLTTRRPIVRGPFFVMMDWGSSMTFLGGRATYAKWLWPWILIGPRWTDQRHVAWAPRRAGARCPVSASRLRHQEARGDAAVAGRRHALCLPDVVPEGQRVAASMGPGF